MKTVKTSYRSLLVHPRKKAPTCTYEGRQLSDVYGRYSHHKHNAYMACLDMCRELGGYDFGITAHSCQNFTISFIFPLPDTGELMRAVVTSVNADAYYL